VLSKDSIRELDEDARELYDTNFQKIIASSSHKVTELRKKSGPVNVSDYVDHIDYLVEKIGIDHVGISSDFDGGGGVEGWRDASETFNVTLELVKRGYTEHEIAKLWGENLLRVLDEVEAVAKEIQKC
jgi:membrane dipeptidase/D-alanyl-D-alanine dipeptidase